MTQVSAKINILQWLEPTYTRYLCKSQNFGRILEKGNVEDCGVNRNLIFIGDRIFCSPQLHRIVIVIRDEDVVPTSRLPKFGREILYQTLDAFLIHGMFGGHCHLDCNHFLSCADDGVKDGVRP
jgi:hypothetical protein